MIDGRPWIDRRRPLNVNAIMVQTGPHTLSPFGMVVHTVEESNRAMQRWKHLSNLAYL